MSTEEMRKWIDNASYLELLRRWRFASVGSPWLQGEIGDYYADAMRDRRAQVANDEHIRASKSIGW